MTQLGGFESEGVGAGSSSGSVTIEVSAIPTGNYVLVLGASPGMDGAEGKMFITGEAATDQKIFLNFGTTGTATVSFDKFATNGADGWTVDGIVTQFGTP
jgi:hypothetical protein